MWRDFLWRVNTKFKHKTRHSSESSDSDVTSIYGATGHYSFGNDVHQSSLEDSESDEYVDNVVKDQDSKKTRFSVLKDEMESDEDDSYEWQQKFEFLVSLLKEPRLLLGDSLTSEALKLTLKRQAFRMEKSLVLQSLQQWKQITKESSHIHSGHPEIDSLKHQLRHVNRTLSTLQNRLEVLKAVQSALPSQFTELSPEEIQDSDEPDSLEECSSSDRQTSNLSASGDLTNLLALLRLEKIAHQTTKRDLIGLKKQLERLRDELEWRDSGQGDDDVDVDDDDDACSQMRKQNVRLKSWTLRSTNSFSSTVTGSVTRTKDDRRAVASSSQTLDSLTSLDSVPTDKKDAVVCRLPTTDSQSQSTDNTQAQQLQAALEELQKLKDEQDQEICELQSKLANCVCEFSSSKEFMANDHGVQRRRTYKISESAEMRQLRSLLLELQQKEIDYKERIDTLDKQLQQKAIDYQKYIDTLEKKLQDKDIDYKGKIEVLEKGFQQKEIDYREKIDRLEIAVRNAAVPELPNLEDLERHINSLEQLLEQKDRQLNAIEKFVSTKDEESSVLRLDCETLQEENRRLKLQLNDLTLKSAENSQTLTKLQSAEDRLSKTLESNKKLSEDLNRERILRKKYFNTIEDLKGKIRVYCRVRPLNPSEMKSSAGVVQVVNAADMYTVQVQTTKGDRDFQFDRVFLGDESQESIFEDTQTLVQSAYDGYNVCICAYGQTGSGKTYTIVGDEDNPGVAPRAFRRLFDLVQQNEAQFETSVSLYMLELYNDKLLDLLKSEPLDSDKLEIKKDKRGVVWVQGATTVEVSSSGELEEIFRRGLEVRHTSSTRMNDRSSRSHLILSVNVQCTSRLHGTVTRGKLSLLDLAGSERMSKSGASGDQLREASSINKSLSSLGDVISALANEQSFVPYRNSKLTLLMQDSLGGNAKTLLFVTVSPSAYNLEETLTSLTYASRAKQITNAALRNAESKEIARLKSVIQKLRRGELIDDFTS